MGVGRSGTGLLPVASGRVGSPTRAPMYACVSSILTCCLHSSHSILQISEDSRVSYNSLGCCISISPLVISLVHCTLPTPKASILSVTIKPIQCPVSPFRMCVRPCSAQRVKSPCRRVELHQMTIVQQVHCLSPASPALVENWWRRKKWSVHRKAQVNHISIQRPSRAFLRLRRVSMQPHSLVTRLTHTTVILGPRMLLCAARMVRGVGLVGRAVGVC